MDTTRRRPPGAEAVGRRISVRFRLPDGSASDVVGRVLYAGSTLRLERRDGTVATVDTATIIIWRVVPDRPVRSRRPAAVPIDQLTRLMTRGWPPVESEQVGTWELRAASGFTKRANSAAAAADPELPLEQALDAVVAFYEARGLPPLLQVPADSDLDARLDDERWPALPDADADVLVAQLDRRWPVEDAVEVAPTADAAWLAAYGRTGDEPAATRAVLEGPATVGLARLEGSICRVVVTGEWAGFAALWVPEEHRRQGLGLRLMTSCLGWAVEHGADKAYLQVETHNDAALALYRRLGFVDHHTYRYRQFTGSPQAAASP